MPAFIFYTKTLMSAVKPLFKYLLFLTLLFIIESAKAQHKPAPLSPIPQVLSDEVCGTDIILNTLRQDKTFREREQQMNRQIAAGAGRMMAGEITLPVVFHIITPNPTAITDAQIQAALQDLNDAFSKSGAYAASTGADTKIRFCLAQKDPEGGTSTGITRTNSFFGSKLHPQMEDAKLKDLIQWDPIRYINVWLVQDMEGEIFAEFGCGQWQRQRQGGYATMPPGGGPLDGIVISGFGPLFVHEMGHYLGLYHTFEGNCANNDCSVDGDMICDTPPDASRYPAPCGASVNSCSSDTLSGFSIDMPDPANNFMDYANAACQNEFTEGQAVRMRGVIATQRSGLLEAQCVKPCSDMIVANYTRDVPHPQPGTIINFTNTSTGASNYEWLINDVLVATTQNYSHAFGANGKYKVTVKAFNTPGCYATYTTYVMVDCGVEARFYTDKRLIASKDPIYLDSILFTNTSHNGVSYQWLMRNDAGMAEQVVSTATNLNYVFKTPGNYFVRLIATNGSCSDTSNVFDVPVQDPTHDGALFFNQVDCYQQTKLRVSMFVCNYGYAPIPPGIPISFYDTDPRVGNAKKLGTTFFLPDTIQGKCCGYLYTHIVDVGVEGLNQLYAVFNDSGTTMPLKLPNTSLLEKDYNNNLQYAGNLRFRVNAIPPTVTLEPGDTVQLRAQAGPGIISSYVWSPPKNLSCTNCQVTDLIADSTTIKQVIATSQYGCRDTAIVDIKVPPANDYTINLVDVQCARNDSMYVEFNLANSFKRGVIPKNLSVSFYKGDPATSSAVLLSPTFVVPDTVFAKTATFSTFIKGMDAGNFYAVVNDNGSTIPLNLPNTPFLEKNYLNNTANISYKPEVVLLNPSDTTVIRNQSLTIRPQSPVYDPSSTIWTAGPNSTISCTTCPSITATVSYSTKISMQTANQYGCMLKGEANIKILPPDMQVEILEAKCYSNNTTKISFRVCMNNNYDSVYGKLPIAFYDSLSSGAKHLLTPVFYTPIAKLGNCNTYVHYISTPATRKLFAVVNDKAVSVTLPDKVFDETDYANNVSQFDYTPFDVVIHPSDTSIARFESVLLTPEIKGGIVNSYLWKPSQFLSCITCSAPIVTLPYTMEYSLITQNEFYCVDTAYAIVKTFTGGVVNMPNAFTPNRDNKNDIFYVLAGPSVKSVKEFSVFNRWGERVFNVKNVLPNDPRFGWNGEVSGHRAPTENYVYLVEVEFVDGKRKVFKGTVVLIR